MSGPRWASVALALVTALLLAATALSGYARSELTDPDAFSARMTSALDDADVREVVADKLVGGLTRSVAPDLLVVRPLLVPAAAALADTAAFRRVFARAARARHRRLTEGEADFALDLGPGKRIVIRALRSVSPRFADALPADPTLRVAALDARGFELVTARILVDLAGLFWILLAVTALAGAACAALAGGLRRALVLLGGATAGAGLAVIAMVMVLGNFVVSRAADHAGLDADRERAAVDAVWDALMGDLVSAALVVALAGAVVAALAMGARPFTTATEKLVRAARSEHPAARTARLAAIVLLGLALLFEPTLSLRAALAVAGVLLVVFGVAGLASRLLPASDGSDSASPKLVVASVLAVTGVAAVGVLIVLPAPRAAIVEAAAPVGACNGSRELCRRRLNEVVFPSTHNSYAAADEPGWFFANQRHGIERQLEDGIRGFTLDIHYGRRDPDSGLVRTDLGYEGSSRNKVVKELGPGAVATAERLAGRVGSGELTGERGLYLCHTLCELGSEPLREQLDLFARFLERNPREVLLLFIEPYVPPAAIEPAMREAGLRDQAAELRRDRPLPTLGRLVRSGERVVVFAEDDGGALPWYLPGFSFVQDTPLGAETPRELSCARFRGDPDSPMLLLNHWIPPFPPSVSDNARIGGDALRERAERCGRLRGQRANLLAVDFHERSGVIEVAEELNRGG